jgi:TonB-dependent starch-binding outer membrane protein SusC
VPIYNADGSFVDLPDKPNFYGDGYNPVGLAKMFDNKKTTDRYFGKVFGIFKIAEGLTLTSNFGFDSENGSTRRVDRTWGTNGRINSTNGMTLNNRDAITWTNNNVLNYSWNLGESHVFSAILGLEAIKGQDHGSNISDRNFPDQDANLVYLGNGLGIPNINEFRNAYTLLSFFSRVDYSYDSRYLLSASFRRDGSSRFVEQNRWGNFYALSGAWNIHNEAFLKNNSLFSQLKLRVGYGQLGNQEIGYYAYSDYISPNYNYPTSEDAISKGYAVTQLGNTDLKWETSSQINAGLDFELKDGIIFGSVDYFYKITDNMLVKQPNPPSSGYAAPSWVNNGKVLNTGMELLLGVRQEKGDFGYSVSGNVAWLHNEVLELAAPISGGSIGSNYTTLTEVGQPIGSFYMLEMEGIFQNELDIATSAYQGSKIHPGDVKYKDQDGNSIIDEGDRIHVGSPIPKVTAGLNISTNYKNFDLTVFFQGAYGYDIYNVAFQDIEGFYRPFNITKDYYDNRWTGEGSTNEYPRASWSGANNNVRISTRFLKDGSYTRLKNLQLGYNFPVTVTDKLKLGSLRVYMSALNLLTFTKYPGLDPEMTTSNNASGQGDLARGIDWGTYPVAKSYNFGLNLTF